MYISTARSSRIITRDKRTELNNNNMKQLHRLRTQWWHAMGLGSAMHIIYIMYIYTVYYIILYILHYTVHMHALHLLLQ